MNTIDQGVLGPDKLYSPGALNNLVGIFKLNYGSFSDIRFTQREKDYKAHFQKNFKSLLAQDALDDLIANGQFEAAKAKIKQACTGSFQGQQNNLLNQHDMRAVLDTPAETLVHALYNLLYGTGSFIARFDAWVDVLAHDVPGVWPTATYFLMMHDPSKHIFVKAEPYKKLLHALYSKVKWQTRPTAARYLQIRALASKLLEELAPLGAHDMIDVQSFIYVLFPTPTKQP